MIWGTFFTLQDGYNRIYFTGFFFFKGFNKIILIFLLPPCPSHVYSIHSSQRDARFIGNKSQKSYNGLPCISVRSGLGRGFFGPPPSWVERDEVSRDARQEMHIKSPATTSVSDLLWSHHRPQGQTRTGLRLMLNSLAWPKPQPGKTKVLTVTRPCPRVQRGPGRCKSQAKENRSFPLESPRDYEFFRDGEEFQRPFKSSRI